MAAAIITSVLYVMGAILVLFLWLLITIFIYFQTIEVPEEMEEGFLFRGLYLFFRIVHYWTNVKNHFNGRGYVVNWSSILFGNTKEPAEPDQSTNVEMNIVTFNGVKVRQYRNLKFNPGQKFPAIIFIHGGGWCMGDTTVYHKFLMELCQKLGTYVAAIDYHLAPENKFPGIYNECLRASKWFLQNYSKFLVDRNRIAIMGDSAGGQLATSIAQTLNENDSLNLPPLKLQVLIYPITQVLDFNTPSFQNNFYKDIGGFNNKLLTSKFYSNYILGEEDNQFAQILCENRHLTDEVKAKRAEQYNRASHNLIPAEFKDPPYLSPYVPKRKANAEICMRYESVFFDYRLCPLVGNLKGLPPTYIITVGVDVWRDDGILYAQNLKRAGVSVVHRHYKGGLHGNISVPNAWKLGRLSVDEMVDYLDDNL